MCPFCFGTLGLVVAGTVSTGGVAALAVKLSRKKDHAAETISKDAVGPWLRRPWGEEGHMCPACIASTAVMVAGAGSAGGIPAVCIGKFRKFFRASDLGLFQKKGEMIWQQVKRETRSTR